MHSNQTVDEKFVIWLAGFFDGEGCLRFNYYVNKRGERKPKNVRLFIGQAGEKGKAVCEYIRSKIGGRVKLRMRQKKNWKDAYVWIITKREEVVRVLKMLLPHLRVKKKEVEEKLEILRNWMREGRKYWTHEETALLKKYPHLPVTILAKVLKRRSYDQVKNKKVQLGLKSLLPPLIANKLLKIAERNQFREEILDELHNMALSYLRKHT